MILKTRILGEDIMAQINLAGQCFQYFKVIRKLNKKESPDGVKWLCLCKCGNTFKDNTTHIKSGYKRSCGCQNYHLLRHGNIKHHPKKATIKRELNKYKQLAKKRNYHWKISDWLAIKLFFSDCVYCGSPPLLNKNSLITKNGKYISLNKERCEKGFVKLNGIDRVDNNKGYIESNVVSCCATCNFAKNILSKEDFLNWINRLISFRTQNENLHH